MTDYTELIRSLRNCSNNRCTPCDCGWFDKYQVDESCKEIIMWKAAAAIEALEARLGEAENSVERWKDMYLTTHEPKRGKWIEDATTYAGQGLSNYKCSLCGKICGTWRRGLEPSELPNWCGNCGADMRAKMEVQDGQ